MRNVVIALVAAVAFGMAQDKPADSKPADTKPQKVAKNQEEADLINSLPKTTDPNVKLQTLDKWTKAYPDTQFADERALEYLDTYQKLRKPQEVFNKAKEILAKHPNNFAALSAIIFYVPYLNNGQPSPADLDTAEQAANHLIKDADTVFSEDNKPAGVDSATWQKVKTETLPSAQKTIGMIYFQRKDWPRAEVELTKALKEDPTQGQVAYMLATALFSQRQQDPKKQPPAIFEFARAGYYSGANALPAQTQTQLQASTAKMYKAYHGSEDGYNDVVAQAKANALPPDGFTIKSNAEIEADKATAQAAADAANPMLALWRNIREQLIADGGPAYFDGTVKDAALPGGANGVAKFKGKIVSMTPENRPKEIVLAIEKPGVADATLKFEAALPGKMEPGEELEFEGVAKAYQKEPFMLTFEVEKDKLVGWTGKNAPAGKKTGGTKKKAQ